MNQGFFLGGGERENTKANLETDWEIVNVMAGRSGVLGRVDRNEAYQTFGLQSCVMNRRLFAPITLVMTSICQVLDSRSTPILPNPEFDV